jgi:hypothetical protein
VSPETVSYAQNITQKALKTQVRKVVLKKKLFECNFKKIGKKLALKTNINCVIYHFVHTRRIQVFFSH